MLRLIAFVILAFVPALAPAQPAKLALAPAPPTRYADAIAAARALMRDSTIANDAAPGVSVAVAINGEIVWTEGFGYADLEQRVSVWPSTRFRIGSVSKSLTSAALGILVDEGKLDLDSPVQRYVPSFPAKRWPVSVRQVGGHLAGIRHYRGDENNSMRPFATVNAGLEIFRDDSLLFEPGTRYLYSSYGWNLLSAVIEGASGKPYLAYMNERVLAPLGLRETVADHPDSVIEHRTRYYEKTTDRRWINSPYVDNSYKWAGGGYLASTADMARFGSAILRNAVVKPATTEILFTSRKLRNGTETDYGIGWSTGRR